LILPRTKYPSTVYANVNLANLIRNLTFWRGAHVYPQPPDLTGGDVRLVRGGESASDTLHATTFTSAGVRRQ
jgi:hypothetical protein